MILNHDLSFSDAPSDVQRAFTRGKADKTLLKANHHLYKFTQFSLLHAGKVTPWWSSVKPISPHDTGLEELLQRADRLSVNGNAFARARNAVTRQWNSMEGLLVVMLRRPVYGFVGPTSHQRLDTSPQFKNVLLIGGAIQLWIPNLTVSHVRLMSQGKVPT